MTGQETGGQTKIDGCGLADSATSDECQINIQQHCCSVYGTLMPRKTEGRSSAHRATA